MTDHAHGYQVNGQGPWWCPVCGRPTPTPYRCSNYDCGADLAGKELEEV